MKKLFITLAALGMSLGTTSAHAAYVDMTAELESSLSGSTYTYDNSDNSGVDVTVRAIGGSLSHETGDGFGVDSWGDGTLATNADGTPTTTVNGWAGEIVADDWGTTADEVNGAEAIVISFSSEVSIEKIFLTDLYASGGEKPFGGSYVVPNETGAWAVFSSEGIRLGEFTGVEVRTAGNGELTLDMGSVVASAIGLISTNGNRWKGFSVAGVEFNGGTSVPELSASGSASSIGLLIGAGIVIDQRRRRSVPGASA
jgi:hypothetical protein